jgi:hypothetical protein
LTNLFLLLASKTTARVPTVPTLKPKLEIKPRKIQLKKIKQPRKPRMKKQLMILRKKKQLIILRKENLSMILNKIKLTIIIKRKKSQIMKRISKVKVKKKRYQVTRKLKVAKKHKAKITPRIQKKLLIVRKKAKNLNHQTNIKNYNNIS